MPYSTYMYDGPVTEFNKCVCDRWTGKTVATSEKQAKSNLTYQFKKQTNRSARTCVCFPGELTRKEG